MRMTASQSAAPHSQRRAWGVSQPVAISEGVCRINDGVTHHASHPTAEALGWDWQARVHVPLDAGAQLEQAVIGSRTLISQASDAPLSRVSYLRSPACRPD